MPDNQGGVVTYEFVPQHVIWARNVQRYGLPNQGGWLDQPHLFMREIQVTQEGLDMYSEELRIKESRNV